MISKSSSSPEKHGLRFWSLAVAAGLLSSAVVLSGLGLRAAAPVPVPKEEPKKDEPKKDAPKAEPKKDTTPAVPNLKEFLPSDLPPEVAEQLKKQMEHLDQLMKQMEQMQQQIQQQGGRVWNNPAMPGGFGFPGRHDAAVRGRMGALIRVPDATLVDQLDLPKNQGLVIGDVKTDSPAAKAGLKAHDILLELNGKPVTSEPKDLVKMLEDIKPNTPVDAVVLRKGKKETIKGLSMPEAPKPANLFQWAPGAFPGGPALGGTSMSMSRNGDNFSTTYQEGQTTIAVSGKIDQGKAKVEEITVTENGETKKYKSIDDVPANLRDKVKNVIRKSEGGGVQTPEKKID